MNKEPETYEELIRQKRCVNLLSYYSLTKDDIDQIYKFLEENPKGNVTGGVSSIILSNGVGDDIVINATRISTSIDGLKMNNSYFSVIPHYDYSSSGGSSGGGSSNNNNNNNNNNR